MKIYKRLYELVEDIEDIDLSPRILRQVLLDEFLFIHEMNTSKEYLENDINTYTSKIYTFMQELNIFFIKKEQKILNTVPLNLVKLKHIRSCVELLKKIQPRFTYKKVFKNTFIVLPQLQLQYLLNDLQV